jgi:hypothetical protein
MLSRLVKRLGEQQRCHWDLPRGGFGGPPPPPPPPPPRPCPPPFHIGRLADDQVGTAGGVAPLSQSGRAILSRIAVEGRRESQTRPPGSGGGAEADAATTVSECARSCCNGPVCVSWQHRRDVGCLRGGDVRLGMEKDGLPAWCSDHPLHRWRGQFLLGGSRNDGADDGDRGMGGTSSANVVKSRKLACDESTWNPKEEVGQCFGLGDVRPNKASGSAVECMRACCGDPTSGTWQWNKVVRSAHPRRYYLSRPVC